MAQKHTYRIIIARPGYQPRTVPSWRALAQATAANTSANSLMCVRVAVELVPLQAPQTAQEATQ